MSKLTSLQLHLPSMLKSRTVQSQLLGVVLALFMLAVPELEAFRLELLTAITAVTVMSQRRFTVNNTDQPLKSFDEEVQERVAEILAGAKKIPTANIYKDNPSL